MSFVEIYRMRFGESMFGYDVPSRCAPAPHVVPDKIWLPDNAYDVAYLSVATGQLWSYSDHIVFDLFDMPIGAASDIVSRLYQRMIDLKSLLADLDGHILDVLNECIDMTPFHPVVLSYRPMTFGPAAVRLDWKGGHTPYGWRSPSIVFRGSTAHILSHNNVAHAKLLDPFGAITKETAQTIALEVGYAETRG